MHVNSRDVAYAGIFGTTTHASQASLSISTLCFIVRGKRQAGMNKVSDTLVHHALQLARWQKPAYRRYSTVIRRFEPATMLAVRSCGVRAPIRGDARAQTDARRHVRCGHGVPQHTGAVSGIGRSEEEGLGLGATQSCSYVAMEEPFGCSPQDHVEAVQRYRRGSEHGSAFGSSQPRLDVSAGSRKLSKRQCLPGSGNGRPITRGRILVILSDRPSAQ